MARSPEGAATRRRVGNALLVAGVIVLVAPVAWAAYTSRIAAAIQTQALAAWERRPPAEGSAAPLPTDRGGPRLRLTISRLGLRRVVAEGAGIAELRRYGIGRVSWTALPGGGGIVGIAGHRTTYGAPFFRLDELRPGDAVVLDDGARRYTYRVTRALTVHPDQVDVLDAPAPRGGVALITCTPRYSAARRLVVFADLAAVTPLRGGD